MAFTAIHLIDILFHSQPLVLIDTRHTHNNHQPPTTPHNIMSRFAVLSEDYAEEAPNTPQKIRTTTPTILNSAVSSNSAELRPGHVGMFLGAKHVYVQQAREFIQAETGLRLHHSVSKDGVVTFHFRGAIHKKNLLRMAYQTLFNTLGKRSIETGFGVACDSSIIKFVLGKNHSKE